MKRLIITFMVIATIVGAFALTACSNNVKIEYDPSTKYGVYWYSDDGNYVRSSSDMSKDLFDPSKPTFVFAHGWEPDEENSSNGLVEDLVTHPDTRKQTKTTEVRNYAKELREQGYNVALLGWFSYAKDLGDLFRFIWVEFDGGNALSVRFAQELAAVLGEDYSQDVKMVGHSYGSQVALATTYQLTKFKENGLIANGHIIPTRLTLADPYIGATELIKGWKTISQSEISYTKEKINGRAPKTVFADEMDYIVSVNDIAVDIYCGMSIASTTYYKYDGSDADFEKLSKNCSFVKSAGLLKAYGDFNIHNVTRDWVLLSIVDKEFMKDDNENIAPSGAASDEQIKSMRGKCYNQNYRGLSLSQDSMTLVDRTAEKY